MLGLVSLPVSNFGGFIVGFLFALIGGAMAVAWAPGVPPAEEPAKQDPTGEGGAPEATDYDTTLLRPVNPVGEPSHPEAGRTNAAEPGATSARRMPVR